MQVEAHMIAFAEGGLINQIIYWWPRPAAGKATTENTTKKRRFSHHRQGKKDREERACLSDRYNQYIEKGKLTTFTIAGLPFRSTCNSYPPFKSVGATTSTFEAVGTATASTITVSPGVLSKALYVASDLLLLLSAMIKQNLRRLTSKRSMKRLKGIGNKVIFIFIGVFID